MRYNNSSRYRKYDEESPYLVKIDLNIDILDKIIIIIFIEDNPMVNVRSLYRIKQLFELLHPDVYSNNYQLQFRVYVINALLRKLFVERITDRFILADSVRDGKYKEDVEELFKDLDEKKYDFDDSEIDNVNRYISDRLKYCYIKEHSESLNKLTLNVMSNNYTTLHSINREFEKEVESLYGKMKKARDEDTLESLNFGSNPEDLKFITEHVMSELRSPCNKIHSGFKRFDEMSSGGFQRGRVYCFIGAKKGFKSGLLLNFGLAAKQCNPDILDLYKNKNKKPCIVYLTQENTSIETYQRILSYYTGKSDAELKLMENSTIEDELIDSGFLDGIEIKIIYKNNNSISTMDLIPILEELEMNGSECILLIHDYLKRIRPAENIQDLRIRFGEVVNEFSVIAKNKNIPIITAMQLNRAGQATLETLIDKGEVNIGQKLQGTHIGESALVLENVDNAYLINKEEVPAAKMQFLTFKECASRTECKLKYFAQEFAANNKFRIKIDHFMPEGKYASHLDISQALGYIGTDELDPKKTVVTNNKKKMYDDVIKQYAISSNSRDFFENL